MNILKTISLTKHYGSGHTKVEAVRDVTFSMKQGEIIVIQGPSGSGKTTLISMIGGLLRPSYGSLFLEDINIADLPEKELPNIRLKKIGFVFQAFNLLENITALENVMYAAQLSGSTPAQAQEKSTSLLTQLHLDKRFHHLPKKLSGGEKQRVAIARALINKPTLVLADEPTGNLDSKSGYDVIMLFHNIAKKQGKSVIIVSHDPSVQDIANRVLWLEDGKLCEQPPGHDNKVTDVVCGMRIDARTSTHKQIKNNGYYLFCSQDCKDKFAKNPDSFI